MNHALLRILAICLFLFAQSAISQEVVELPSSLSAAKSLILGIDALKQDLAEKRQQRSVANLSTAEIKAIEEEIDAINIAIAEQEENLEAVVTGIDMTEFREKADSAVVLETEVRQLLEPFVRELRRATARPRETEQLRTTLATLRKQRLMAADAVANIEGLLAEATDPQVKSSLENKSEEWGAVLERANNQLSVAEFQLQERQKKETSVYESMKNALSSFFRTRGRNALGAITLGVLTFVVLRFIHRFVHRISPIRKRGKRSIAVRLADVVYYLFTVVMSILAALGGLYLMGDWMLLGLALVVLLGVLWACKESIIVFFEQVRLMLNLGSVREGERLIYNGIPWNVNAIKLYCDLVNPQLRGGHLKLPLRDVVSLVSREADPEEFLFPCNEDDWVMLSDGVLGKVVHQSPEWVQLVLLGGSRVNYATADFIGLTPRNLSTGFRIQAIFGVDYDHQSISTTEIPTKMQTSVESGLRAIVKEKELVHLKVEVAEAAASSINYAVIADFTGAAAPKHRTLERALQRLCIDACNENGWSIPFTQITLHQAPAAA